MTVHLAGFLTFIAIVVIWVIVHYFRWYSGQQNGVELYLHSIKMALLAPLYYFWGYTCKICGKKYLFDHHAAFMCCPGPHNAEWRRTHPNEKCLTDPNTLPPSIRVKTIPGYREPDPDIGAYMRTCPWCGGSGRKYGVVCDECDGTGKVFRDAR